MFIAQLKTLDYTRYINIVAILYAFTLPLSRASISLFTIVLILLWIFEADFKKKLKYLSSNTVIRWMGIFLLFNLLSLLWTDYFFEALEYIKKYWFFSPVFIFFTSLRKEYLPKVLSAFVLGMFVSEVIAYGVFFELWNFKYASVQNPSPFMHHIEYSVFLAFTGLILLGSIFNAENIKYKILYIFFFITVSGNLFLTEGRTGQLAFVLGLFVLIFMQLKSKLSALIFSTFLSLSIIVIAYNMSSTFNERISTGKENLIHVVKNKNYCTSWGGRVGSWIVSKDIIWQDPILGIGIIDNMKSFHSIIDSKYPEMKCIQDTFMHTHNQYLEVFTQLGIVGLFIFIGIFFMIARVPIMEKSYKNMKYIYLAILLFSFIPEVLLHRQFSMALFALVVGLLLAQSRIENER